MSIVDANSMLPLCPHLAFPILSFTQKNVNSFLLQYVQNTKASFRICISVKWKIQLSWLLTLYLFHASVINQVSHANFNESPRNNKIDVNAKIIILPGRDVGQVGPKCIPPMHIHCRRLIAIAVECPIDDGP